MNLKDAQIILSLNETGNITKTAECLFITQPALSKRIQNLEQDLGSPILLRHQKGIVFTPLGEKVIEYAHTMINGMAELHDYADASQHQVSGTLEAGIAVNYARYCLPFMLQKYVADFPCVSVNITTGFSQRLYQMLSSEELSLAVVRGDYPWYEGKILLAEEPLCVVYHRDARWEELSALPYINRHTDPSLTTSIQRYLAEQELIQTKKNIHIDDMDICLDMAKNGFGWTILPSIVLKDADCNIKPMYLKDGTPITRTTFLLFRNAYQKLPQAGLFIQYLTDLVPEHIRPAGR